MKHKTMFFCLLFCMAAFALCGCRVTKKSADQQAADLATTSNTDIIQQTGQETTSPTSAEMPVIQNTAADYIAFMENLNPEIAEMDELSYLEMDADNDGNMEIVAAFGNMAQEGNDAGIIKASFALRDRGGEIELIKQDFCDGRGYECCEVQFARFSGSPAAFVVVGITNQANMNGLAIYEIIGGDMTESIRAVSPAGVCSAYLHDDRGDGLYGGFIKTLSSYDVLYYPVTTFYNFSGGRFEAQNSTVSIGEYPSAPEEAVIQYLSLILLNQRYNSGEITERIHELAENADWDIFGSADDWQSALYKYISGIENSGEPNMIAREAELGSDSNIVVVLENSGKAETVTLIFDLELDEERWHITFIDPNFSSGIDSENITFVTYPIREKYYNSANGYAELDLTLPAIDGYYGGIETINEFFAAKKDFFYGELPLESLESAGEAEGKKDGYFRSAHYRFAARIGDIVSIWADLDGGAGGVGWQGIEGDVFRLGTGKKLILPDIFNVGKDQYSERLHDFVAGEIAANIARFGDGAGYMFDDPYSGEGYESIRTHDESDFYLTEDCLVVFYPKYVLADGASGPQVFYIPYDRISDILAFELPAN
ncbi:MAG: RsiV family protein [Oscillospiraceae bacterium]|nr:RsiV family protein [Oscillospiraceae bacterium]